MAEIDWIKLKIDFFSDQKIKQIKKMPEGKSILLVWISLLTMAGKLNDSGLIYISRDIPYDEQMLSVALDEDIQITKLALNVLSKFGLIDLTGGGFIGITNWGKHQNIDGMVKIREQNRKRVERYRKRQKAISAPKPDNTEGEVGSCNVTVTQPCNVTVTKQSRLEGEENRKEKEESVSVENPNLEIINEIEKILTKEITAKKRNEYLNEGPDSFQDIALDFAKWWVTKDGREIVPFPKGNKAQRLRNYNYQNSLKGILRSFSNYCGNKREDAKLIVEAIDEDALVEQATSYMAQIVNRWTSPNDTVKYNTKQILKDNSLEDFKMVVDWFKEAQLNKNLLGDPERFKNNFPRYLKSAKEIQTVEV